MAYGCATTAGSATDDIRPWLDRLFGVFGTPNFIGPGQVCTWSRYSARSIPTAFRPRGPIPRTPTAFCCGYNPWRRTRPAPDGSQRRAAGAKLIVIDPREHTGQKADCWLRVARRRRSASARMRMLFDEDRLIPISPATGPTRPFWSAPTQAICCRDGKCPSMLKIPGYPRLKNEPRGNMGSRNRVRGERDRPIAVRLVRLPLPDGSTVLRNCVGPACLRAAEYTRQINDTCAPEDVRRAAQMFATERPSGYESWTGTEMHSGTLQMNWAIQCFYALTGQFDAKGAMPNLRRHPATRLPPQNFCRWGKLTNDLTG